MTAVDFSSAAPDKARRLAQARRVTVDFVLADLRGYRLEPGVYHLVLVAYLHLPPAERAAVLAGAVAALAPGGTLLVIGHDLANLTQGVGGPRTRRCSTPRRPSSPSWTGLPSIAPNESADRSTPHPSRCSDRHLVRATRD